MPGQDEFAALTASFFDQRWHFDPVEASAQGLAAHDARLGDYTDEAVRQHVAGLKALGNALEALDLDAIDDEIDRTALLNALRIEEHRWSGERPHVRDPAFWVGHLLEGLYHVLAAPDRAPAARTAAVRARLEAAPAFLDAAEATLSGCPRPFVETASAMLGGGRQLIEEAGVGGDAGMATAREAALGAVDRFAAFLQGDTMDRAQEDFAVGIDAFNFRLAFQHALRATAPEVLRYGAALMEEVSADLERLAADIAPGTPWPDLLDRLRADHPDADGLVDAYRAAMANGRQFLEERDLVTLEDLRLDVVATPRFLAPVIPFAAYQPPPVFGSAPAGRFYVTEARDARALRDHCTHEIPGTAVHEGWPGHHLQFARAARLERDVRRLVTTPVTVEGWATYCEQLLADEGFLATPKERFFQRVALLWRALRVVLDIGLHTQGVSRQQAADLLVDRIHMDRGYAEAEVRRYAATPAYQLAYAVGRRELASLREAARSAWGPRFTLRSFHDTVLTYGGLPVSLMRWGMGLDA